MNRIPLNPNFASILEQARVTDDIQRFHPEHFPLQVQNMIALSKSCGQRVVAVYWPTGEFAVMPCEINSDMPSPERVITSYYGCKQAASHAQEAK